MAPSSSGLGHWILIPVTGIRIPVGSLRQAQCKHKLDTYLMWFVYMLLCDEKTFYIGISDDLKNRLFQHKNKLNISTKKFSDFDLVYAEKYQSKFEAAKREKQLKGWSHAKKQMLIDGKLGINACTELAKGLVRELEL